MQTLRITGLPTPIIPVLKTQGIEFTAAKGEIYVTSEDPVAIGDAIYLALSELEAA